MFISIKEALKKKKGHVALRGWVHRIAKLKDKIFLVLRDSSGIIQCIIKKDSVSEKEFGAADKLLIESAVELQGEIYKQPRAPTGFEVEVSKINVVHYAEPFPITKHINEELLLDRRHLWLRSRKLTSVLKIRSTVFGAIHEFFRNKGFYEFHSPIIIPSGAEEGPTLFEINYYGKKAYLTQTWQLYAEAAIFALEKIYTIAPSFRAEKSKTSRHLTEFWHAEMEVAWLDNLDELIDYAEALVKHIVKKVLKNNKEELEILKSNVKKLEIALKKSFPRITYDEVLKLLKEKAQMTVPWGKDLRTIEEAKLGELFDTPVFVTHYPKEIMAFYKPRDPKNPKVALCFDLIAGKHGELIGGSLRDLDIEELKRSLKSKGEKIEDYLYYLDTRRYGSVPHGGFGMGVERVIKWICDLNNIKDAIAFPRTPDRFRP